MISIHISQLTRDFTLTPEQVALQKTAKEFAQEILKPLVAKADAEPDPLKGFQMVKPAYVQAYQLGLAMGFIPTEYGGGGVSNIDIQLVAEEICAVDPGFACILLVNGLALLPVHWFANQDQKKKWLTEATSDPNGEYVAGWTVSEPAGTPGGTAEFDHPDSHPFGIGVTADHEPGKGQYVPTAGNAGRPPPRVGITREPTSIPSFPEPTAAREGRKD